MAEVVMESWQEGMKKVSLTKLQIEKLGISLHESKKNVDSLLDNKKIILETEGVDIAEEFIQAAEKIGVICKLL